ncbi:hypothetical protein [Sorangium sp. So ce1000]|uniref:hypothetical protein n=1 Tax=Sorangium sp. So ce1000 TaxID=3133325 RepID=UPI003F626B77
MGDGGDDLLNGDAGSDTFLESGVDDAYDSGSIQRGVGGGVAGTDTLDGDRLTNGADGDVCLVEAADSAANCEL